MKNPDAARLARQWPMPPYEADGDLTLYRSAYRGLSDGVGTGGWSLPRRDEITRRREVGIAWLPRKQVGDGEEDCEQHRRGARLCSRQATAEMTADAICFLIRQVVIMPTGPCDLECKYNNAKPQQRPEDTAACMPVGGKLCD